MSENFLPSSAVTLVGQPVHDHTIKALNAQLSKVQKTPISHISTGSEPERDILLETKIQERYRSNAHTDLTGDIGTLKVTVTRMTVRIAGNRAEKAEFWVEIATKEFPFSFFQFTTPLKSAVSCPFNSNSPMLYYPHPTVNQNLSRKIRHETRSIITDFCTKMAEKVTFADREKDLASIF